MCRLKNAATFRFWSESEEITKDTLCTMTTVNYTQLLSCYNQAIDARPLIEQNQHIPHVYLVLSTNCFFSDNQLLVDVIAQVK